MSKFKIYVSRVEFKRAIIEIDTEKDKFFEDITNLTEEELMNEFQENLYDYLDISDEEFDIKNVNENIEMIEKIGED